MKKLILLYLLASFTFSAKSQSVLGMSRYISLSKDTVNFGDSVTVTTYVKNKGLSAFTGTVQMTVARDTTAGQFGNSASTLIINLQPNDSVSTVVTFTPTSGPTGYKVLGNGNTIVVWPYTTLATIKDSVRTTIWIFDTDAGINELNTIPVQIYPNPAEDAINFIDDRKRHFRTLTLYNTFGQKIMESDYGMQFNVSGLAEGMYWIILTDHENKRYRASFIKR